MAKHSLQEFNGEMHLRMWSERIAVCRSSGKSVNTWCRENGFHPSTYYRWQRRIYKLAKERTQTEFAEIRIPSTVGHGLKAATLRINGLEADIYSGADEETMASICRVMKSC